MVTSIDYPDLINLIKEIQDKRTRALIAFQYASAARIGELLSYNHNLVHPDETKEEKKFFKNNPEKKRDRKRVYSNTKGLIKSNFSIGVNKIVWVMPNFKTKTKKRMYKEPFVLKEETVLWDIIKDWLSFCGEQVFELKESRVRELIRKTIGGTYSSHVLRKSRGTHLADIFGYNAYEIREALGHSSLETGIHYVSTANSEKKMRAKLIEMNEDKT